MEPHPTGNGQQNGISATAAIPAISVIIPAFNELECVELLQSELPPALQGLDAEIVVIDDGSTDGTGEALAKCPDFRVVRIEHSGKSAALLAGMQAAKGETVVMIDADLQEDPQQLTELLEKFDDGVSMVSGVRVDRSDGLFRKRVPSRIYRFIIFVLFGRDYKDINCGFRVARRDYLLGLRWFAGAHRLLPLFVDQKGGKLIEAPVRHRPRRRGAAKYDSPMRFLGAIRVLLKVRLGLGS